MNNKNNTTSKTHTEQQRIQTTSNIMQKNKKNTKQTQTLIKKTIRQQRKHIIKQTRDNIIQNKDKT